MTTISPNRKRSARRMQLVAVLVLIAAIAGVALLARAPLANLFWVAGTPLSQVRTAGLSGMDNFFAAFRSNYVLVAENEELRALLASTSIEVADRDLLYRENIDLKSRLGRIPKGESVVLGSVLLAPPATPYDTLMIDVGRGDGVAVGDPVAAGGSVYIGTIEEVYVTASRVKLFSAPGSSYHGFLIDQGATSSLAIVVEGQGGGSLRSDVPLATLVHVGDQVLLPSVMPEITAHVVYVEEKSNTSFKTIYMQLPVSIYDLRFVEVHRTPPTHGGE